MALPCSCETPNPSKGDIPICKNCGRVICGIENIENEDN